MDRNQIKVDAFSGKYEITIESPIVQYSVGSIDEYDVGYKVRPYIRLCTGHDIEL